MRNDGVVLKLEDEMLAITVYSSEGLAHKFAGKFGG